MCQRKRFGTLGLRIVLSCGGLLLGLQPAFSAEATHKEGAAIRLTGDAALASLSTLAMNGEGKLLVCDQDARLIRVVSPEGKVLDTWKPNLSPQAICIGTGGVVYVAGSGKVARLDKAGKVLDQHSFGSGFLRSVDTPGIAATDKEVFVAVRARTGFELHRLDQDLGNPKRILEGVRGCCGQLDVATDGKDLYLAENTRHEVVRYSREGKVLGRWGKSERKGVEGFGGCCNPMSLRCVPGGEIYTIETRPDRIKRYTTSGKFLGLVAEFDIGKSCIPVAIGVTQDGNRVFVADSQTKVIRVLTKK